jgi:predicted XRE-type DNA-binding protein
MTDEQHVTNQPPSLADALKASLAAAVTAKQPTPQAISALLRERWLPVPGWVGLYEASDRGRVRSLPRKTRAGMRGGRLLTPSPDRLGYQRVYLSRDGIRVTRLVHHLVLEAHDRLAAPGEECRHLDGSPSNNELGNLKWDTHIANEADKRVHGTLLMGERNHSSRLGDTQVALIRELYSTGNYRQKDLAEMFGVTHSNISCVVRGKTWATMERAS